MLYLSERINDLGIECSHFANSAGLAFEAWEKGLLGTDRTDGLELTWGNLEATEILLYRCARRIRWLGNLLADRPYELASGSRRSSAELGRTRQGRDPGAARLATVTEQHAE